MKLKKFDMEQIKQVELPDFFIIQMFYFINCFEGPAEFDEVLILV